MSESRGKCGERPIYSTHSIMEKDVGICNWPFRQLYREIQGVKGVLENITEIGSTIYIVDPG